jgi:MoaA/NifB/PqqE/SkfB family radical SAM enzyme
MLARIKQGFSTELTSHIKNIANAILLNKYRAWRKLQTASLTVLMDVTNCCNLNCVYCSTHQLPMAFEREIHFMPIDLFSKIAHQTFPYARTLKLSGAYEPTLHPEFHQILEITGKLAAGDAGFSTNGVLLDETMSRQVLLSGINHISIALDAWSTRTFETIRKGVKRDLVYENLERFLELRDKLNHRFHLQVSFVLIKENVHELLDVARFAIRSRAHCINVIHVLPRVSTNPHFIGNHPRIYEPVLDEAREILRRNNVGYYLYGPHEDKSHCRGPWSTLSIDPYGKVNGCYQRIRESFGDFASQNFDEIWDDLRFLKLRRDLARGTWRDECVGCQAIFKPSEAYECGRNCE